MEAGKEEREEGERQGRATGSRMMDREREANKGREIGS